MAELEPDQSAGEDSSSVADEIAVRKAQALDRIDQAKSDINNRQNI